jgi:hypothetical protein
MYYYSIRVPKHPLLIVDCVAIIRLSLTSIPRMVSLRAYFHALNIPLICQKESFLSEWVKKEIQYLSCTPPAFFTKRKHRHDTLTARFSTAIFSSRNLTRSHSSLPDSSLTFTVSFSFVSSNLVKLRFNICLVSAVLQAYCSSAMHCCLLCEKEFFPRSFLLVTRRISRSTKQ